MEQSPSWEASRFAARQEFPRILRNPKVHYRIHKCSPPVLILGQLDSVYTPTSHFLIIHLNIILPSMPGSPQWSLSLRLPHHNTLHTSPLPHMHYMPRPSHSSWYYHPHNIGWGVQINKLLLRNGMYQKLFSMLVRPHCFFSGKRRKWQVTLKNEWNVFAAKAVNDYASLHTL